MITTPIWLVVLGWVLAGGSPGPATLAISGTSMAQGRRAGLSVAGGVLIGSASWGIAAGLGMSALMLAHSWVFETIRVIGAAYLGYLAIKSLRRAARNAKVSNAPPPKSGRLFAKGMAIHLTNPKAILAWGSIYAIALPVDATGHEIWRLFFILISSSAIVFLGYAILFSNARVSTTYRALNRWFDLAFGVLFGAAAVKILTADLAGRG